MSATTCPPKWLLSVSRVLKYGRNEHTGSGIVCIRTPQNLAISGCVPTPVCRFVSTRSFYSNGKKEVTVKSLCCCNGSSVNLHSRKVQMSSWLRSTGVVFITGGDGSGNGGNNDAGFPKPPGRGDRGKKLGETCIIRQEGHHIEEVPVAVIRTESSEKLVKGLSKSYVDLDPREEEAFVQGFKSLNTPQEVLKILDTIPSQEVTPFVAFSILQKLFELENNFGFRNHGKSWLNVLSNSTTETFTRLAIVTRLVDTILTSENSSLLLDTLDLLRREGKHEQLQSIYDSDNQLDYSNKLLQEALVRVTEGKLNLREVCRAVTILGKMETENKFKFSSDFIDKFSVGILDLSDEIDSNNVVDVLSTVKYFKKSSRFVLNLVERKMCFLWWKMNTDTVAKLCLMLSSDNGPILSANNNVSHGKISWHVSTRVLTTLSKCTNLNIHLVSEIELINIVKSFNILNHCDTAIEQALNKYMKAKGIKIVEPQLVATIMDYVLKFRLRSTNILQAAAEFVVKHSAKNLSPPQLTSIFRPFGELEYHPQQGPKFWEIVEMSIHDKFIQFPPKDIILLLLACVYLMKYPLNFVERIFSPYFLDRLHTSESDFIHLQQHRSNLKLLDTAMTIECKNKYGGPMLPKDFSSKTIFIDGRIRAMGTTLGNILTGNCKQSSIETTVVLPGLPLNPIFTADVLLVTPKIELQTERNIYIKNHINSYIFYTKPPLPNTSYDRTIILIHIPEHYSSDSMYLIGLQTLRRRLLTSLGFNVVSLNYHKLSELKSDTSLLWEHVAEELRNGGFKM